MEASELTELLAAVTDDPARAARVVGRMIEETRQELGRLNTLLAKLDTIARQIEQLDQ